MTTYPQVSAVGVTVTSGSSTASAALPTDASGQTAKVVLVVAGAVANAAAHVKFGQPAVTATANDLMVTDAPVILAVGGCTHFAYIQRTAATIVNVTPVET